VLRRVSRRSGNRIGRQRVQAGFPHASKALGVDVETPTWLDKAYETAPGKHQAAAFISYRPPRGRTSTSARLRNAFP
jgi:hypothetical protein